MLLGRSFQPWSHFPAWKYECLHENLSESVGHIIFVAAHFNKISTETFQSMQRLKIPPTQSLNNICLISLLALVCVDAEVCVWLLPRDVSPSCSVCGCWGVCVCVTAAELPRGEGLQGMRRLWNMAAWPLSAHVLACAALPRRIPHSSLLPHLGKHTHTHNHMHGGSEGTLSRSRSVWDRNAYGEQNGASISCAASNGVC